MSLASNAPSADGAEHRSRRRRRALLGATVADSMREQILQNGLEPGSSLPSEAELADEYDVSLRVVRDALRTLTNQGIIETRQGKRAVVADLRPVAMEGYFQFVIASDSDAIRELLDLRVAVETQAARAAAKNASQEQVEELRRLLDAIVAAGDDVELRPAADIAFHLAIVRSSGNRFFLGIVEALDGALRDERQKGASLPRSHDLTNRQHVALYNAIKTRDPERAERAMMAILVRARELFEKSRTGTRNGQKRGARPRRTTGKRVS